QAYGGQGWSAQLEALAGEGRESLARPGRGLEQMIQSKTKGHRVGGLFGRQAMPQCICWMPASSQPLEPSAGLTRFHTSSKPTGAVPGVSRTMPEQRTPVRKSTQREHHAYSEECQQEHSAESAAAKEVAKQAAEREAAKDRHPAAARRLSGWWLCGLRWRRDRRRRDISLRADRTRAAQPPRLRVSRRQGAAKQRNA